MPISRVEDVLDGRAGEDQVRALISAIVKTYPISPQSFVVSQDDTDDGALILSSHYSLESQRIFNRANARGDKSPYYEYRDTAMSRLNGLRPEWIRPLRFTPDPDPENKDVAMNNGHLLHQVTFFAGDINFYFEDDGRVHSSEMSWGDSNYIPPFIPHSFTTRDPEVQAFIVAITFAGPVKKDLRSNVDEDTEVWTRTLQKELAPRINQKDNFLHYRIVDLVGSLGEIPATASGMFPNEDVGVAEVNTSLATSLQGGGNGVLMQASGLKTVILDPERNREGLQATQLATPPGYLETTFLHLKFCDHGKANDSDPLAQFMTYRGVYVYCLGPSAELTWIGAGGLRSRHLAKGDSVFMRSFVPFAFSGDPDSELILAAVPGDITQVTLLDLQHHHDIKRAMRETQTWFN